MPDMSIQPARRTMHSATDAHTTKKQGQRNNAPCPCARRTHAPRLPHSRCPAPPRTRTATGPSSTRRPRQRSSSTTRRTRTTTGTPRTSLAPRHSRSPQQQPQRRAAASTCQSPPSPPAETANHSKSTRRMPASTTSQYPQTITSMHALGPTTLGSALDVPSPCAQQSPRRRPRRIHSRSVQPRTHTATAPSSTRRQRTRSSSSPHPTRTTAGTPRAQSPRDSSLPPAAASTTQSPSTPQAAKTNHIACHARPLPNNTRQQPHPIRIETEHIPNPVPEHKARRTTSL